MIGDVMTVFRKETRSYWVSPIPYVVIGIFSAAMAARFFFEDGRQFFLNNQATMHIGFFHGLEAYLVILVPLISMRLWSEEVRAGTIESLLTSPVTSSAMVVGKFLSAWVILAICLLSTLGLAFTASGLGDLDWGPVLGGYLGAWLLCGGLLAIGSWVSSFTAHQLLAFIVTLAIGGLFFLMQEMASTSTKDWAPALQQLSLTAHFEALGRGVVELRDLVYYGSVITFFLYLNVQSIENRRYA